MNITLGANEMTVYSSQTAATGQTCRPVIQLLWWQNWMGS